jgi:hypothetical protein
MERSQGMASGNTGFQVGKSIKLSPLLGGDLNPILGFCFPPLQGGIVHAHEQHETYAWACLGRQKISLKSASS